MVTDPSDTAAQITLKKFFSECESKFRFLELHYNFIYLSGLVEHKNNSKIIKPYAHQELDNSFLAVTRYEKNETAFEITFSPSASALECLAYYGPILRFSLEELLIAGRRSQDAGEQALSLTITDTPHTLTKIADTLQNNMDIFCAPSEKMIGRALSIRNARLETAIRKKFSERLKSLTFSAARAYREKNYRQVIALLHPYKNYLGAAELKKLELARKQLLS
jgi:hypothetical protein